MSKQRPWMVALLVVACCYGSLALAELTPVDPKTRQDIIFQILGQIANRVTGWEAQVTSAASYLFWTLGSISLTWTMGMMILKRADLGEFFAEFIRFIFFFGLFYGLLRQGPTVAKLILESMLQLGQETAGSTIKYQTFMDIGMELMSRADQFQQTGASKEDGFLVVGLCGAILLMLTTMVINLFLVFVAGWFLMYAGIFFLGFGGSRWTSDIAIGYYKAVIAVGIQMFVMALIMGIATDVLGDFFEKFSFELRFYELMTFLVATFAFMTIFNRIPTLLSGLISGASIGTSQGELGGALRGANGADPFGAGRTALGTAVGGAQKVLAAIAAGQPKTENPIPQIAAKTATDQPMPKAGAIAAAFTPVAGRLNSSSGEVLASKNPQGAAGQARLANNPPPNADVAAGSNPTVDTELAQGTEVAADVQRIDNSSQGAETPAKLPIPGVSAETIDASSQTPGVGAGNSSFASGATSPSTPSAVAASPSTVEVTGTELEESRSSATGERPQNNEQSVSRNDVPETQSLI